LKPLGVVTSCVTLSSVQPFRVAAEVEREDHLGSELAGLFQHGVDGVDIDVGVRRAWP
jgi:hypothetical protein